MYISKIILAISIAIIVHEAQCLAYGEYKVTLSTADELWAGTSARVFIKLYGAKETSDKVELQIDPDYGISKGTTTSHGLYLGKDLGDIGKIEISHDNTGSHPGWLLKQVVVHDGASGKSFYFPINRWLDTSTGHTTTVQAEHSLLPQGNCGRASSSRVVNGNEAKPNSWPWMGKIVGRGWFYKSGCGTTLIHPQYVVTAAHCLYHFSSASKYQITFGEHDTEVTEGSEQHAYVEELIVHPKYSRETIDSDIALMKLSSPVQLNANVQLACLPEKYLDKGRACIATGWGKTSGKGSASTKLLEAVLPTASQSWCNSVFRRKITPNMVCAGGNNKGVCMGDSGGPLVCRDSQQKYRIHGISSFVASGCNPRYYSVFTRVTPFVDWINNMIGTNVKYV